MPIALLLEPIPLRELAARITAEGAGDDLLSSLLDEFETSPAGGS